MGWIVFIVVFLLARFFVLIPHSIIMGLEANSETTVSVNTSATGYQSYFAICLIIKNDPDIVEWIDYHRKMGCSKFYVHDHSSGPPLNATIASHIESGLVEYSYLQGSFKPNPQIKVYKDCIEKHKDKHTFMVTRENFHHYFRSIVQIVFIQIHISSYRDLLTLMSSSYLRIL